jgi:hypothetical protein
MSRHPANRKPRRSNPEEAADASAGPTLDLTRYIPAFVTFIANKLSNSASVLYQRKFGINVTEWRIMSLLAIEPGIPASRICYVIGFNKGPVSRTLAMMQKRGLVAIRTAADDGRSHSFRWPPGDARRTTRSSWPRSIANGGCCPV